jgi:hypothetical protein
VSQTLLPIHYAHIIDGVGGGLTTNSIFKINASAINYDFPNTTSPVTYALWMNSPVSLGGINGAAFNYNNAASSLALSGTTIINAIRRL